MMMMMMIDDDDDDDDDDYDVNPCKPGVIIQQSL